MTKYRPADFADDETSSMGSIQIGNENSNNSPNMHVRFENPGANNLHNQMHYSGNLAYLQQMVSQLVRSHWMFFHMDMAINHVTHFLTILLPCPFRTSANSGVPGTNSNGAS